MTPKRSQIVRRVPVRYVGPKAVFAVPPGAGSFRVQAAPVAFTRGARVLSVRLRIAPPGSGGFTDHDPAEGAVSIGASPFVTGPVDCRGAHQVVVECTTGEGGSDDVFEDIACTFDAGMPGLDERAWG